MKLTTFFVITFALLLGTGVFFAARQFGWFERPVQAKEAPPETKQPAIMILVAADNLFEGVMVETRKVKLRELMPHEARDYQSNRDKYLPATVNAVHFRTPNRNIGADTPLLKEYFEEFEMPGSPDKLLKPGMRAINVAVPKGRCVGGIIRRDDHVDIMFTCKMLTAGEPENAVVRTACIARNCRIIIKRNSLFTTFSPNPDDKPVDYTLELNPYRAALLEFAQQKGQISLVAVPAPQQKIAAGQFSDPTSKEYADEDERVQGIIDSTYTVSDADLARIFQIKPPSPRPSAPGPIVVRHISGTNYSGATVIGPGNYPVGNSNANTAYSNDPPATIFMSPEAPTDPNNCPSCNKGKKKK